MSALEAWVMLATPAAASLRAEPASFEPDWIGIGLALAIVGTLLLGNALMFRHPRSTVREMFGERRVRLRALREHVFHRVQVGVGFSFVLAGLCVQFFARYWKPESQAPPGFPVASVIGITVLTVGCLAAGWWWSARAFRRYLREHLLQHPPDFEGDPTLAREVGDLFGVATVQNDTVQSYAERLRERIGLPHFDRRRRNAPMPREDEVEIEEGAL